MMLIFHLLIGRWVVKCLKEEKLSCLRNISDAIFTLVFRQLATVHLARMQYTHHNDLY